MPNAKDFKGGNEKFLVIGQTGSGKTSLFTTIPGKKFLYVFDPNALNTIKGQDIDYEIFVPDTMKMDAQSLSKGKGDGIAKRIEPLTYVEWEADFEKKVAEGFFDQYDVVGFDSLTTLCDLVMDRVLYLNGRFGMQPQQDDWGAQISTLKNIFRQATSLSCQFFATAHKDLKQDDLTKKIFYQIILPGQLRTKVPILFSEVWNCEADEDSNMKPIYVVHTRPTKYDKIARSTITDETHIDVTIPKGKDPAGYGIGAILRNANK